MEKFYIQTTMGFVGNSMMWWKHDNCGYSCDIRNARVFTESEAKLICPKNHRDKRMWPKRYIDERVAHHIDMQDCDYKQAFPKRKRAKTTREAAPKKKAAKQTNRKR